MREVKGLRSTGRQLQSSPGDVKCSIGRTGNDTVIAMRGATWVLEVPGESLCKYVIVQPLCCTPESNTE